MSVLVTPGLVESSLWDLSENGDGPRKVFDSFVVNSLGRPQNAFQALFFYVFSASKIGVGKDQGRLAKTDRPATSDEFCGTGRRTEKQFRRKVARFVVVRSFGGGGGGN